MRRYDLQTFLLSLAVIVLEVSYTRVFSFKLVYYFTYLIIGISLLGLGSGGVLYALIDRLRSMEVPKLLFGCSLAAAIGTGVSYFLVALVPLRLFGMMIHLSGGELGRAGLEALKLTGLLGFLFLPFLCAGLGLAAIFATQTERIGRLYFADLVGAALGAAIVIPLLTWVTPPGVVFGCAVLFSLVSVLAADGATPFARQCAGGAAVLFSLGFVFPGALPDPVRDPVKGGAGPLSAVYSEWNPVFRVDVVPVPGTDPSSSFLVHDGTIGSSIQQWDGDVGSLGRYADSDRSYPFRILGPGARVAIIGSAGGNEVLASLHFEAADITGVELNPVTLSLLTDHFADFTGHLADHDRVRLVNAEGRSYLSSAGEQFDLIWLVAPDSYAAMNAATSGAFVLSESYLYTQEMIEEAVAHLLPEGILCAQFGEIDFDIKPNRTLRYLGTARQALAEHGIEDFAAHVLVAVSPGFGRLENTTILIKRTPFTAAERKEFEETTARVGGARVAYLGGAAGSDDWLATVAAGTPTEVDAFLDGYAYDVRPITDDSPFFWNFVRARDTLLGRRAHEVNVEEGIGERLMLVFLAIAIVFAAVFLLLPILLVRDVWRDIPYKWNAGFYFGALGLGFLFLEVVLIQRLTLFLGYPTYSLTVTLFAILLSTGVGSLLSERWVGRRNAAYTWLLTALGGLVAFYLFGLPEVMARGVGWSFPVRVGTTVAFLAPLGLCLGAFLPLGLRTVSALTTSGDRYVAWCWAINGFFSVVASVLATLLSMSLGFDAVMVLGLLLYLGGVAAFRPVPAPSA